MKKDGRVSLVFSAQGLSILVFCFALAGCEPPHAPLTAGLRLVSAPPEPAPMPTIEELPEPPAAVVADEKPATGPIPSMDLQSGPPLQSKIPVDLQTPSVNEAAGVRAPTAPLIALPEPPILTAEGRGLILEFETGGRSGYNPHPEWPAAASGVTIGIGYDLRFNSRAVITQDWAALPARDLNRLIDAQGLSGDEARQRARELRDITIPWEIAIEVFEKTTVVKFDQLCRRTWPGYDELRAHSQNSLLSLTFNRGSSMVGEKRRHMRAIRDLSPREDYAGMAGQERAMVIVWRGTVIEGGMRRRRLAEAGLMETP